MLASAGLDGETGVADNVDDAETEIKSGETAVSSWP